MGDAVRVAGDEMRRAISVQPEWLGGVPTDRRLPEGRALYTGCGTSFHAAQTGGPAMQALELVLAPEQEAGDADRYRTHLLHVPDNGAYSLVAAVWRPGQRTAVHDHIAWCVVGVHRGEEHEIRYRMDGDHLVEDGHTVGPCGTVSVLIPPGDIHAVVNDSATVAASLHVYGADLRDRGTSIRRCYRLPVRAAG